MLTSASENDSAHRTVSTIKILKTVLELKEHVKAKCISFFRPIESHDCDSLIGINVANSDIRTLGFL